MDEEQLLLDKLGRSDVNALDTLYVRYAPKVYDFALRFLKNEAEAEDVTPVSYTHLTLPTILLV